MEPKLTNTTTIAQAVEIISNLFKQAGVSTSHPSIFDLQKTIPYCSWDMTISNENFSNCRINIDCSNSMITFRVSNIDGEVIPNGVVSYGTGEGSLKQQIKFGTIIDKKHINKAKELITFVEKRYASKMATKNIIAVVDKFLKEELMPVMGDINKGDFLSSIAITTSRSWITFTGYSTQKQEFSAEKQKALTVSLPMHDTGKISYTIFDPRVISPIDTVTTGQPDFFKFQFSKLNLATEILTSYQGIITHIIGTFNLVKSQKSA